MKYILTLVLLIMGCSYENSNGANTMILQKPDSNTFVIGSALQGVILSSGAPIANAKIKRTLRWNGNDEGVDEEFTTDEKGAFTLPAYTLPLKLGALEQFVAKTDVYVFHNGEYKAIWVESKLANELKESIDSQRTNMTCELANGVSRVPVEHGLLGTICTWENMPEEEDPYAL